MWPTFSKLEGKEWIQWNLYHEAGSWGTIKKPLVTSLSLCADIWVSRCNRAFNRVTYECPKKWHWHLLQGLWGLWHIWSMQILYIVVMTYCINALNLCVTGCEIDHPFQDLFQDIRALLSKEWQVVLKHFTRQDNFLAYLSAKLFHCLDVNFCWFDSLPLEFCGGAIPRANPPL